MGLSREDIYVVNPDSDEWPEAKKWLAHFLLKQPESYVMQYSAQDMVNRVDSGELIAWFRVENGKPIGLMLLAMRAYATSISSIKIEFVSCEHWHKMVGMWEILETQAARAGFTYVEALSHPTLAKVAVKKHGFKAPAVYIIKQLPKNRRN